MHCHLIAFPGTLKNGILSFKMTVNNPNRQSLVICASIKTTNKQKENQQ